MFGVLRHTSTAPVLNLAQNVAQFGDQFCTQNSKCLLNCIPALLRIEAHPSVVVVHDDLVAGAAVDAEVEEEGVGLGVGAANREEEDEQRGGDGRHRCKEPLSLHFIFIPPLSSPQRNMKNRCPSFLFFFPFYRQLPRKRQKRN